ncbi:MAG: alginate lyase family protein [Anaerolineales bacterium]
MTARSRLLIPALRELGLAALLRYGAYWVALRTGLLRRRTKPYQWSERPLESWLSRGITIEQVLTQRKPFFFDAIQEATLSFPSGELLTEAEEILAGKFRLFGGPPIPLGTPPDWGKVVLKDQTSSLPLNKHWTEYESEDAQDLRLLWEPARFGWAYTLCRAYQFTGEQRYAAGAFDLLRSWLESNQPNCGPHWSSGQEVALRLMALIFLWYALPQNDFPSQAGHVLAAMAAHAERIPPTLSYARAQRNNHLITEAVGLYGIGLLMPWFERAAEWKRLGRRWLVRALKDQVFDDGGYIQYSTNYQRLALSAGLWAARLAEINGEPLPEATLDALQRMASFLQALSDPHNGELPNWGPNDGSNILPLSDCEHDDYRPVLQAASRAFTGGAAFDPGPWDELSMWLGLPIEEEPAAPRTESTEFPDTGLYLVRGETSRAVLRCVRFAARPGHSDQLHTDLWWSGHYVVRDAGTYLYTGRGNSFAHAAAHNSILTDGREPMDRVGKFLWLNWSNARFLGGWQADDGSVQALAAEHSLRSGATHRRSVVHAGGSLWVVLDELLGSSRDTDRHKARLAWGLIDWPWEFDAQKLTLKSEQGPVQLRLTPGMDEITLYRAGERVAGDGQSKEDPAYLGWWSPTYGYKEPALMLVATLEGKLPLRLTSWWRLGNVEPQDLALEWDSLREDPLMAFLGNG